MPLQASSSEYLPPTKACAYDLLRITEGLKPKRGFAEAAKENGIKFLMVRMRQEDYAEVAMMVKVLGADKVSVSATGSGINGSDILENKGDSGTLTHYTSRFRQSMLPLMQMDSLQWAHNLIANRGEMICEGCRIVMLDMWSVGIIFPVEILDYFDFIVSSNRSQVEIKKRMGTGSGRHIFNSENDSVEIFKEKIKAELSGFRDFDSFDFHFIEKIPLSLAVMIWIPAPLLNELGEATSLPYPGLNQLRVPPKGQAFSIQVSEKVREHQWRQLPLIQEAYMKYFNPELALGTWFNTLPNWEEISQALETTNSTPYFPLLHNKK